MTIIAFLNFWSDHNDMIIKVLIALVLFMIIYLAFRLFFGAEVPMTAAAPAPTLDTSQIEKALQKILDAQASNASMMSAPAAGAPAGGEAASGAASAAANSEIESLKKALAEKEKVLGQARQDAARASALGGGDSSQSKASGSKLESKIKDLEARLAEYEIISEDIADLSFYKEENIRLQTELTVRKTEPVAAKNTVVVEEAPAPVEAPRPAPVQDLGSVVVDMGAASSPAPTPAAKPPPVQEPVPSPEEDELLKEFSKAIEAQKGPGESATPEPSKNDAVENNQLMSQFEKFVKKS